jgi:hypothetical protein
MDDRHEHERADGYESQWGCRRVGDCSHTTAPRSSAGLATPRVVRAISSRKASRAENDDPAVAPVLAAVATIELEEVVAVVSHDRALCRLRVLKEVLVGEPRSSRRSTTASTSRSRRERPRPRGQASRDRSSVRLALEHDVDALEAQRQRARGLGLRLRAFRVPVLSNADAGAAARPDAPCRESTAPRAGPTRCRARRRSGSTASDLRHTVRRDSPLRVHQVGIIRLQRSGMFTLAPIFVACVTNARTAQLACRLLCAGFR